MAHTHTVTISVPLRIQIEDAETVDSAILKARGEVYDWLGRISTRTACAENNPVTVLSVESKR